ncbi:MAG: ABC transporter substrate-binding protein [Chlorobi bacterium]|nr:ABC transporter substrate-binding protein [Chlorobiota bacterium]MCI0715997.1 ABC transporter substrate-binding protein [Chlorobiota bacterium]
MKTKLTFLLLIALLCLLSINCTKKQTTTGNNDTEYTLPPVDTAGAVAGDWIIQRELADPQSLNPVTLQDATGREFSLHIFERLMWAANRENYDLLPWLAEGFPEESPDHLTYTYKIKKNINFSNGKPFTGRDVIFTFKAMMNPLTDAAQSRQAVDMLKNVELSGGDEHTVKFTLSRPYFKAIYALCDVQIMSKEAADPEGLTDKYTFEECRDIGTAQKNPAMKKFADFFNSEELNRDPKYLIGTGPYIFEKWETGQWVYFRRNANYWNSSGTYGMAYPERMIIRVIQDQSAAVVAAKNKEIDLMYVVKPADFVQELKDPERFSMKKANPYEPVFSYLAYNNLNQIFADVKVRRALAYLVDRKSIIERIHFGLATPIQSPVYFQDKKNFNPELPEIPYDLEKAKQLLSEAGWTDSDGNGILDRQIGGKKVEFKFTYLSNTNVARRQSLLIVTDALKKVGIISDVQDLEWSVFLEKLKKHEFDAFMGAWVLSDYPPDEYQLFHSSQSKNEGSNYTSYNNPEADKLMEEYRSEFDETKRAEILKNIQKVFYDDQVYTFLWTPNAKYVYGERFKNVRWYPTPLNSYQTTEWWVPPDQRKFQTAN